MEVGSAPRFMGTPAMGGVVRVARVRDGVVARVVARVVGLPLVGLLLLVLILITAGCGPPS